MIEMICKECGDNDLVFEAFGFWNIHEQDYDWECCGAFCNNCNKKVEVKEIKIKYDKKK